MNPYLLIPFISLLIEGFTCVYIFALGLRTGLHRAYLLFSGSVFGWIFFWLLTWLPISDKWLLPLIKIETIFWIPIGFLFLNFTFRFIKKENNFIFNLLKYLSILAVILSISTNLVVKGIIHYYWGSDLDNGILLIPISFTIITIPFIYGFILLYKKYNLTKDSNFKKQLLLVLIGTTAAFLTGMTTDIILPYLFHITNLVQTGPAASVFHTLLIFYAITRHKFFSISVTESAHELFSNSRDTIALTDQNGNIVQINKASEELFGLTINQLIETKISNLLSGYNSSENYNDIEFTFEKNGKTKNISLTQSSVFENGTLLGKIITMRDITLRKKTEEDLRTLSLIASKTDNAIYITDNLGKIEWVNDGFTKLTGYTLQEIIGTWGEILRRGNETGLSNKEIYERIIHKKQTVMYEVINFTKDSRKYWVSTTLTPVLDTNDQLYKIIAIDSDISEKKRFEEELRNAKDRAERSEKIKDQFLANMSHEIRTPMNGVIGMLHLLNLTELNPEQTEYVKTIKYSTDNLLRIINDILDFSKIQAGKIDFEKIDFDLRELVYSMIQSLKYKADEKKLDLRLEMSARIPHILIGDPVRLNQILLNLVSNAIKFTEKGWVEVSINIVDESIDEAVLEFEVKDTGIGISDSKYKTIFDAFSQASSDTTRKYGGTGLGLTIAHELVELQGGRLIVFSKVNEGTNFTFRLRYGKSFSHKVTSKEKIPINLKDIHLGKVSILLAEDNTVNQLVANKILTGFGFEVEIAETGRHAIDKLKQKKYDLILMDLHMPEMDGYQAVEYIKTHLAKPYCDIPIMAMTAGTSIKDEQKALDCGMCDFISKPFNPDTLFLKIAKVIKPELFVGINEEPISKNKISNIMDEKIFDPNYLQELAGGDKEFIKKMTNKFFEQVPEFIELFNKSISQKDFVLLKENAHKMKSSVGIVGSDLLQKMLADLEEKSTSDCDFNKLETNVLTVIEKTNILTEELRKFINFQ